VGYNENLALLQGIKKKYADEILGINGVHGIGLRVNEKRIVVYAHEITPETALQIPFELDGIEVDIVSGNQLTPSYIDGDILLPKPTGTYAGGDKITQFYNWSGNGYYSGAGTIGSYWWSKKLKKPVILSNAHVLTNQAGNPGSYPPTKKPEDSLPCPIQIVEQSNGTVINDVASYYNSKTYQPQRANLPLITSITPSANIAVGDCFSIVGDHFGYQPGSVTINGERVYIIKWTMTRIDVKLINKIPIGSYDLIVHAKGDDVWLADYTFPLNPNITTDRDKMFKLASFVDANTLFTNNTDANGYIFPELGSDVAIAEVLEPKYIKNYIEQHGAYASDHPNYNYYATGRQKQITGICLEPRENIPVTMTGITTGTTYSIIQDAHADLVDIYNDTHNLRFTDCVIYGYTTRTDGTDPLFSPGEMGMSGSSVMVASVDEVFEFFNYYSLVIPDRTVIEQAFINSTTGEQDIFVGDFIGNNFTDDHSNVAKPVGIGSFYSVSDKVKYWIDRFQLEPIATTKETSIDGVRTLSATTSISSMAQLVQPDLTSGSNIQSTSSMATTAYKEQQLSDTNLEQIAAVTDIAKIEFNFGNANELFAYAKISSTSTVKTKAIYKELIARLKASANTIFKTSSELIDKILNVSAQVVGQSNVNVNGKYSAPDLEISAKISSNSSFSTQTELTTPLEAIAKIATQSGFNTTAVIYEYVPSKQYETITFTIDREIVIECKITKQIDLNFAV
jgi:hypothetical protein